MDRDALRRTRRRGQHVRRRGRRLGLLRLASSLDDRLNSDQPVLTQTADEYDDAGDQTFETDYNRLPGETATAHWPQAMPRSPTQPTGLTASAATWRRRITAQQRHGDDGRPRRQARRRREAPLITNAKTESGTAINALVSGTAYGARRGLDDDKPTMPNASMMTVYNDEARQTDWIENYDPGWTAADENVNTRTMFGQGNNVAQTEVITGSGTQNDHVRLRQRRHGRRERPRTL